MFAEVAAYAKSQGLDPRPNCSTRSTANSATSMEIGHSVVMEGADGAGKIQQARQLLRRNPPISVLERRGTSVALVKTTAIILKSQRWGDADRIVTCYSKNMGKIRGVARGARRQKSRFGAALEPFSLCRLNLFVKNGDSLFRISHVDLVRSSQGLREDLRLMDSAARMVNVVSAITPDGDQDPPLFDTLSGAGYASESDPSFLLRPCSLECGWWIYLGFDLGA